MRSHAFHLQTSEENWRTPDLSILDNGRDAVPAVPLDLVPEPWRKWIADTASADRRAAGLRPANSACRRRGGVWRRRAGARHAGVDRAAGAVAGDGGRAVDRQVGGIGADAPSAGVRSSRNGAPDDEERRAAHAGAGREGRRGPAVRAVARRRERTPVSKPSPRSSAATRAACCCGAICRRSGRRRCAMTTRTTACTAWLEAWTAGAVTVSAAAGQPLDRCRAFPSASSRPSGPSG